MQEHSAIPQAVLDQAAERMSPAQQAVVSQRKTAVLRAEEARQRQAAVYGQTIKPTDAGQAFLDQLQAETGTPPEERLVQRVTSKAVRSALEHLEGNVRELATMSPITLANTMAVTLAKCLGEDKPGNRRSYANQFTYLRTVLIATERALAEAEDRRTEAGPALEDVRNSLLGLPLGTEEPQLRDAGLDVAE